MTAAAADPAARFARDLDRLGGFDRPLLAVSGGPDSLALLWLTHAIRAGGFAVATVDHGLRSAAAAESAMVAALCRSLGVVHAILLPVVADGASVQAHARAARYDALAAHADATGCDVILTAHHTDDQAETFLMRAVRGSGVDGLAGVRSVTRWQGVAVARPLLGWRRRDLAAIVGGARWDAIDDPSNRDIAHDRTRVRALLADRDMLDPPGLARAARAVADASEALEWSVARLAGERVGDTTLDTAGLPREYRRRLLALALARHGESDARGSAVDVLLQRLDRGVAATLGGIVVRPGGGGLWHFAPAPPRRSV